MHLGMGLPPRTQQTKRFGRDALTASHEHSRTEQKAQNWATFPKEQGIVMDPGIQVIHWQALAASSLTLVCCSLGNVAVPLWVSAWHRCRRHRRTRHAGCSTTCRLFDDMPLQVELSEGGGTQSDSGVLFRRRMPQNESKRTSRGNQTKTGGRGDLGRTGKGERKGREEGTESESERERERHTRTHTHT